MKNGITSGLVALLCAAAGGSSPAAVEGENLSGLLEAIRKDAEVPGVVVMALQDGEVAAWAAAGVRAQGSQESITIEDPMHLGSCGKAMTSTLVARLIEDGLLDWTTTIAEALPDFAEGIDPGFHDVTIEQLMRHRGGIAERRRPEIQALYGELENITGTPNEVRLAILGRVMASPPVPPAKNGFDYSNFGYMTAGAMVEHLAKRPWEELIVEKVFRPLGMESAGVGSPSGVGVPVGHLREDDDWAPLPPGPGGVLPDCMGPAGLIHSNLADWGKFVSDHLGGERGEDGLVTSESYKRLHGDPFASRYAAGWGISKHTWSWGEGQVLAHNGSDNSWYSVVFAMPEWDLVVLAASNCAGAAGQQAAERGRDLILEELGFRD